MRRKRSPSHSDNNYNYNNNNNNILNSAFNKLSNNSNSQNLNNNNNNNNASNNDDINSNEPTEPDDSRLLPPTTITTSSSSLNTKVNDKDKRRHHLSRLTQVQDPSKRSHKRSASPAPPIKPPLISNKDVRPFNIPNSKPLTSTTVTNIITSLQPTVDTNIKPRAISNKNKNNNNNNNNNSGNLAGLSDSSEPSSTPFSSVFSSTSNNCSIYSNSSFTSSLTSSFKKFSSGNSTNSSSITRKSITNKTKHINSIFLKRYPNDSSSREGINLDEMITKLLKLNNNHTNTNGSSGKHRKHSTFSSFPIHSWEIQLICSHVREIFLMQPTLLKLQSPIKIVGDIHGQYNDLLRIFKLSGDPSETNYLFLGDYIDRGHQSLETIMLLFCYKIKYRDNFFMLRGNHESANVTKMYGFYDECKRRKSTKVWKSFIDVFNCLPIAAMIQDKIFCIHGGISPDLTSMKQISNVLRPTDIPEEGLITDLLWSDPDSNVTTWSPNDRGVSYTFSRKNVLDFCSKFKFDLIIRGHMVVEDGYEFFAKKKFVTVFSAPNYCGQFGNWGAVLSISTGLICSFELLKPHSIKR